MLKKLIVIALFFISTFSTIAQGFSDTFSDGDFTNNPSWTGETTKFKVNASNQLQLDDPGPSSPAYLSTTSNVISNGTWEFYAHFDFAPSTSNYGRVYIVSNNSDLTGALDGYYVKVGGASGTVDDVSLYRQNGTNSTLIIDGLNGTVGSDPVDLKIRVTRNSVGKWELFTDLSATGNSYTSEGVFTDNTIAQSSYFGIVCNYTSTRSDKFFFDDFTVTGQMFQDTIPPVANLIQVINNNTVELTFNEKLNSVTANAVNNYLANRNIGNPNSAAIQLDSTKVRLTFANNFVNGEEYELEIQNVEDQNGNSIQKDTLDFLYFIPVPAIRRDIVINEFMADPSPPNSLPNVEFIELYNASDKPFDLNNWTLGDASSSVVLTNYLLKPGEYVIVCTQANETLFSPFGDVLSLSNLPSLNNSEDEIHLNDANATSIDELAYDLSWYHDFTKESGGWSIEQINPLTECTGKNNFKASNSNAGGTPGVQNSVFDTLPDLTAPILLNATIISSDSVLLNFNEFLDSTTTTLAVNYTFNSNAIVSQVRNQAPEYTQVLLVLGTALDSGIINTVSVTAVSDCSGNPISSNNTAEMVIPASPNFREVVINEIFADPTPSIGLPDAEFIEVYNASNKIFDITGWTLGDASTVSTLQQVIFSPGDYLIVCNQGSAAAFSAFGNTQGQASFASLGNSGDALYLKDKSGNIIDQVFYSDSWYGNSSKADGGYTLEQINPNKSCTGQNNFKASVAANGGTPGIINSVNDNSPDISGPKILNAYVISADSLLLEFDEFLSDVSLDSTEFLFSNSNMVLKANLIAPENKLVSLKLINPLDSGELVRINIKYLADCSGNLIAEVNQFEIALPELAEANDIVINEILFNPKSGGVDYVELYNRSNRVISLQDWTIANFAGDSISSRKNISLRAVLLFPNQYLVLTEDPNNVVSNYPFAIANRIFEIVDLPSYNDDEGRVYLFNQNDSLIDYVIYSDDMHFALLQTDDGVSLERLDPDRGSNEAGNFHSAAENQGFGTPGYINSEYFAETKFSGEITIDPELFSPDNDGNQDNLNINYQFDAPGFVANVTIYDEQGRVIKRLVKNEVLGSKGTFTWNGVSDEGTKARIGIYLIFFEAFNTSGDKEIFKKPCVVAGQLD